MSSFVSVTHGGGWLTVTGVPVSQANDLLDASYQLYRHTSTNDTVLRTVSYALPAVLHAHVQTIAPTTYFSPPRTLHQTPRKRSTEEAAAKATSGELVTVLSSRDDDGTTLEPLRWLYKTDAYVPAATDKNVLGVAGYLGQTPSQEDLTTFMIKYRTDAKDATFRTVDVNGGRYDPTHPSLEAKMNIQYAEGMAYPTPLIYYNISGGLLWRKSGRPARGDADLEWLNYLLDLQKIPQTISISYGNEEGGLPLRYAKALCDLFAVLGTRGVSVLLASGDHGVGNGDCKDKSGKVRFLPAFPASCTCSVSYLFCNKRRYNSLTTDSQVRMSLASAARRSTPRSRQRSPGVASRSTFRALRTRATWCPPSSRTWAASMPACTSTFTANGLT